MNRSTLLATAVALIANIAHAADGAFLEARYFEIVMKQDFLTKSIKELGTPEAVALITAGCAAFGVDCSQHATGAAIAARVAYSTIGPNRKDGEEYRIVVDAPRDYQVCKAFPSVNGIMDESTFSASIVRKQDHNGYGIYAVVPVRQNEQYVKVTITTLWVPNGVDIAPYNCDATDNNFINCKGNVGTNCMFK